MTAIKTVYEPIRRRAELKAIKAPDSPWVHFAVVKGGVTLAERHMNPENVDDELTLRAVQIAMESHERLVLPEGVESDGGMRAAIALLFPRLELDDAR